MVEYAHVYKSMQGQRNRGGAIAPPLLSDLSISVFLIGWQMAENHTQLTVILTQ